MRIVLVFLVSMFVMPLQSCKDIASKEENKSNETSAVSPFEPDVNPPEKELNGYGLVFNDEFNHEGPMREEFWNAEKGFRRNNEHQWYQSENGICSGGRLVITAQKEQVKNPDFEANSSNWK